MRFAGKAIEQTLLSQCLLNVRRAREKLNSFFTLLHYYSTAKKYHNLIPFSGNSTFLSWPSNICSALKTWHIFHIADTCSRSFKSRILFPVLYTPLQLMLQTAEGYLKFQGRPQIECFRTCAKENVRICKSASNWRVRKLM
jgi:hypothetical protein